MYNMKYELLSINHVHCIMSINMEEILRVALKIEIFVSRTLFIIHYCYHLISYSQM